MAVDRSVTGLARKRLSFRLCKPEINSVKELSILRGTLKLTNDRGGWQGLL